jgi:DHA1 family multidrug resistance protein-like MFS transporter
MAPWRRTFYASWLAQLFSIIGFAAVIPFLPLYVRELGVEGEAAVARWSGLIHGSTGLSMTLFAPIWGILADRYGRKPMVLRSMFAAVIVLGLMGYARGPVDLLILRLMQGAFTGTITASVALVASVTPPKRTGFTLGMMSAAMFGGVSIGPLLGGAIVDRAGYRPTFLVAAALLLLGGLLVLRFAREEFAPVSHAEREHRNSFAAILAVTGFMATVFVMFQVNFANSMLAPVFPLFVEKLRGTSVEVATITGAIIGVTGVAATVSAALLGHFGDRLGHKRLLVAATLVAGLLTLPQAFAHSVRQLFILRMLFGFAVGIIWPSINAIVRYITSHHHLGKAYGLTSSAACLGLGLGPMAGGYVAASTGLSTPFLLAGVLLILASALVLWRVRLENNDSDEPKP